MMNKKNLVLVSALVAIGAAGCSDASAKLPDSGTALFSVGKQTVTKGDLYSLMNATSGAATTIDEATKAICNLEIEVTDEMKETAQSTLDSYLSIYGDTFASYLTQNNMTEEEYLNEYLIPSLQAEQLNSAYIEQNWASVVSTYQPVKAVVLAFESSDDADAALSALNDGSATAAEAAEANNSSSDGEETLYTLNSDDVDSFVRTVLISNTPDDGWTLVPDSSGSTYYLVRVTDNDADNFKEEVIDVLSDEDQISADCSTYFFKKYSFHVYDKTIYDGIASDYPDYLVQDMTEETSSDTSSAE